MGVLKKIVAVVIMLIGIIAMALLEFSTVGIVVGTIILIVGASIWVMSGQKSYNAAVDTAKMIDHIGNTTLEELLNRFGNMETPLGTAWMGEVQGIKDPCIIFGPGKDDDFIYISQKNGCFYVNYNESDFWIKSPEEEIEKHRYKDATSKKGDGEIVCYATDSIALVNEIYQCVDSYVHDKSDYREMDLNKDSSVSYRFNEEFSLLGQKFSLCEMDGTKIYDVKGTIPMKTFHIYETGTEKEVFRVTKKLLHMLPQYEMYQGDNLYGKFKKKVDVFHDTFEMKTEDGMLQMRSIGAVFGHNYIVKMNDKVIGTIADKMNLSLEDIFYDNYVINVHDEKYRLLMVALGVMAAREFVRDEEDD